MGAGGSLPKVGEQRGIIFHPAARELAPELVDKAVAVFGDRVLFLPDEPRRPFVQDYFPLVVKDPEGGLRQVTTLSLVKHESRFHFADLDARVTHLPLLLDGGSLLLTEQVAFVSEAAVANNRVWPRDKEARARLERGGFQPGSADEVREKVAAALGCASEQVRLLPPMPGELSGHLTTWLRALPGGRLVVPELTEEAFEEIAYAHEVGIGRLVQTFLDVQSADLEHQGFEVVRLPMLPPVDLDRVDRPEGWAGRVHSATSAAAFDIGGEKAVFLPTFQTDVFPAGYVALKNRILDEWKAFYEDLGFAAHLVDATGAAQAGGSLPRLVGALPA